MPYELDLADALTSQLRRLVKQNPHQLAGQFANLDFWLAEVRHTQDVLDEYQARFQQIKSAEERYFVEHATTIVYPQTAAGPALPPKPRRVSADELQSGRNQLRSAFYRFLVRGFRERLIDERRLRQTAAELDLEIDPADLRP